MSDQADDPAHRARTAVARLELVSHAPSQAYDFAPNEVGRGSRWRTTNKHEPIPHLGLHQAKGGNTKTPSGGVRYQDDREPDYPQKSHVYFRQRLRRCWTNEDYERLADEAEKALWAWQHTARSREPEFGSPQWKRWVAESDLSHGDVARLFRCTRRYVIKVRKAYNEGGIIRTPQCP